MALIRPYRDEDREQVGILIADTFVEFNLGFAPPEERALFLGPFQHARSADRAHCEAIAGVIRAPMVLVAEEGGEIVGVACAEARLMPQRALVDYGVTWMERSRH